VAARDSLDLTWEPGDPLLAVVRRVPASQAVHWGVLGTYRARIRTVPIAPCPYWPCYQALLLDASPGSP
jgi:hypothetical protein